MVSVILDQIKKI